MQKSWKAMVSSSDWWMWPFPPHLHVQQADPYGSLLISAPPHMRAAAPGWAPHWPLISTHWMYVLDVHPSLADSYKTEKTEIRPWNAIPPSIKCWKLWKEIASSISSCIYSKNSTYNSYSLPTGHNSRLPQCKQPQPLLVCSELALIFFIAIHQSKEIVSYHTLDDKWQVTILSQPE